MAEVALTIDLLYVNEGRYWVG